MSLTYKAADIDEIQTIIETEDITSITSSPNCRKLINLINELSNGAKNVEWKYSDYGHLWTILPSNVMVALMRENIDPPGQPTFALTYNSNATVDKNYAVTLQW